ncbi:MAG: queuosine salvage family protein, partial [Candidatus Thorarchaeota archaeon]
MNNLVRISTNQSQKLGNLLHTLRPHTEDFLDPLLFPSQEYNNEDIARFFFFVTSIDHRTSPRGKSFEGIVKDGYFQGADLLWHLSLRKFQQNPINFHPEEMVKITSTQIRRWYTVTEPNRVTISNPAERATLLRDCGQQLRNNYSSSVLELLAAAQHRILPDQDIGTLGLLKLLSEFKAYEDPTRKKSFLFLKFILRRNLWSHTDTNNIRIPVDNHLTRIALRTGIVKVSPNFAKILRQRIPLTLRRDVEL